MQLNKHTVKRLLRHVTKYRHATWARAAGVVTVFAALGVALIISSHASTNHVSAEAEAGTRAGVATLDKTTAGASGSQSVRFGTPLPAQTDIASIDTAVTNFMSTYSIPGVSVAVTRKEKLVYVKSYGQMSSTDPTPVSNNNLYRIASLSKSLTSVGIMKLLENNKLSMDSKVFGPGGILADDYPAAPSSTYPIKLQNLLQHTTGAWPNDNNDPMFQHPEYDHKQLIDWTLSNPDYPVGAGIGAYLYSNFGYSLVGRIIEKLSGKPYDQYMQDAVLHPAGITDMTISGNTLAERKSNEVLYTGQNSSDPYGMNVTRMDSHGGWLASATDLARFLVHVDGFTSKADILKPATLKIMTTASTSNPNYASGWEVNASDNWYHTGSLPGTATEFARRSDGFNWVVLCNSKSADPNFFVTLDNLINPSIEDSSTQWQSIDRF